jgi:hypothetical protein
MSKSVNRQNTVPGVLEGDGAGLPALPGGGGVPEALRRLLRELMDDRLLDALIERSRDEAGGLRLTGEGTLLVELVKVVLERALEAELIAHLGCEKAGRRAATPATGRSSRRFRPAWPLGSARGGSL